MKYFIKLILNVFDYFTEKKINKELIKFLNYNFSCLIDVGSHKGEYIKKCLEIFKIEKVYGFEANPSIYKILLNKFKKYNNIVLNNNGVGEIEKKLELYRNIESSSSSFNKLNTNSKYYKRKFFFLNFFGSDKVTSPVTVNMIKLEDFVDKENIKKIDLLKIDTEGYELNVLKGLGSKIKDVYLIHLEHHFDDMIIKNYTLTDIHNFLKINSFEKIFKIKMKFRKSFEYIYIKKNIK